MVSETRGTKVFRPRARLIRLLGNELISDEVMAVVELVKNAYDADATTVSVRFRELQRANRASLLIEDDGDGMSLDTVLGAWLEPATPRKRPGGRKTRTMLGRYPLGEKGVGRFAADKLGADMELVTRSRDEDSEVRIAVCWERFGDTGYLDEVETEWELRSPEQFVGERHGTLIEVNQLREEWDRTRLTKLREGLSKLVSPYFPTADFRIVLDSPDFPELSGHVVSDLVDRAPYKFIGYVDVNGLIRVEGPDSLVANLCDLSPKQFMRDGVRRAPVCGPFRFAIFAWDLDLSGNKQFTLDRQSRAQLRRTAGISLYRDGFRVWPYGSPGDDWLELNQRRVNNPSMRLSTNQVVGVVEITQDGNPSLQDRTSREGLVDSLAVHDLRALLLAVISIVEERRFGVRQALATDVTPPLDPILAMLDQAKSKSVSAGQSSRLLNRIGIAYRRQSAEYEARQARLVRLAGVGLSAQQIASEINRAVHGTSAALQIARSRSTGVGAADEVCRSLDFLERHLALLTDQLSALQLFYDGVADGRTEPVDVRDVVEEAAMIFAYRLRDLGIRVVIEPAAPVGARLPRRDLLQVFIHLFDNAIHALSPVPPGNRPEIRIRPVVEPAGFVFADNGPGIAPAQHDRIFDLYFSRRADGRGLGLHLARTLLQGYGASIRVISDAPLLQGANFEVLLDDRPIATHRG